MLGPAVGAEGQVDWAAYELQGDEEQQGGQGAQDPWGHPGEAQEAQGAARPPDVEGRLARRAVREREPALRPQRRRALRGEALVPATVPTE